MEYTEIKKELKDIAEIIKLYPENLQESVYKILICNSKIADLNSNEQQTENENIYEVTNKEKNRKEKNADKKKVKRIAKTTSYNVVDDINLLEDGEPKFLDFCKEIPENISNEKYNAVCVYYLEKILHLEQITLDHIYTCYKISNKDYKKLNVTISNTKNRGKYIAEKETNNYIITQNGQKLVEIDLRKADKES